MPKIDTALPTDGPSILGISSRVGIFNPTELDCVRELWNAYLDRGEDSGYLFLVLRHDDGLPQGYACFGPHPLTEGTYDLYWIAVDPAAQGCGIGHALLSRVEAEVERRGGYLLLIETSDSAVYAPARRLYFSLGFHLEAIVHDFYTRADNLLIYSKNIDRP
jgi:ribosomal protein S18 acetylase RimI-like enzyme